MDLTRRRRRASLRPVMIWGEREMIGRAAIAAVLLLGLAACGEKEKASGTVVGADGEKATYKVTEKDGESKLTIKSDKGSAEISTGKDGTALPAGFTLYPGATVTSSMRMSSEEKGQSGTVLSFESADMPDKIVAFYRATAEKAGYKIGSEMKTGEMEMLSGKNAKDESFTLTASREDDKTNVSMIGGVRD